MSAVIYQGSRIVVQDLNSVLTIIEHIRTVYKLKKVSQNIVRCCNNLLPSMREEVLRGIDGNKRLQVRVFVGKKRDDTFTIQAYAETSSLAGKILEKAINNSLCALSRSGISPFFSYVHFISNANVSRAHIQNGLRSKHVASANTFCLEGYLLHVAHAEKEDRFVLEIRMNRPMSIEDVEKLDPYIGTISRILQGF